MVPLLTLTLHPITPPPTGMRPDKTQKLLLLLLFQLYTHIVSSYGRVTNKRAVPLCALICHNIRPYLCAPIKAHKAVSLLYKRNDSPAPDNHFMQI